MDNTPVPAKPRLLDGLTKMLHLHRLPSSPAAAPATPSPSSGYPPIPASQGYAEPSARVPSSPPRTIDVAPPSSARATSSPPPSPAASIKSPPPAPTYSKETIITNYDRILDLVRTRGNIKLDEIARILGLKEESVAQELQTLEDNGLVDVKYPAFGEPLIYYKVPEGE